MTITKSFDFHAEEETEDEQKNRHKVVLNIGKRTFHLRGDLTGMEIMSALATSNRATGAITFLNRVIAPEDWDEFCRLTAPAEPKDIGDMVEELVSAYAGFPGSQESESSNGSSTTGDTSESSSETLESTPA